VTTVHHEPVKHHRPAHHVGPSRITRLIRSYPLTVVYLGVMSIITSVSTVLDTVGH